MGWCSPCILPAKLFRQSIEKTKKRKWDAELSKGERSKWDKIMESWKDVIIRIPRKIITTHFSNKVNYEIHAFSDASNLALGAAI